MFERNVQEMKNKARYIHALGEIYKLLEDEMTWNCMQYHEPDETHDDPWFTVPDEADYTDEIKAQYKAYKDVLYSIKELVRDV